MLVPRRLWARFLTKADSYEKSTFCLHRKIMELFIKTKIDFLNNAEIVKSKRLRESKVRPKDRRDRRKRSKSLSREKPHPSHHCCDCEVRMKKFMQQYPCGHGDDK
jgi:hypothetical protein